MPIIQRYIESDIDDGEYYPVIVNLYNEGSTNTVRYDGVNNSNNRDSFLFFNNINFGQNCVINSAIIYASGFANFNTSTTRYIEYHLYNTNNVVTPTTPSGLLNLPYIHSSSLQDYSLTSSRKYNLLDITQSLNTLIHTDTWLPTNRLGLRLFVNESPTFLNRFYSHEALPTNGITAVPYLEIDYTILQPTILKGSLFTCWIE